MTKPIAVTEENLAEMLAQLEAELGGAAPPVMPAPTATDAAPANPELDDLAALEKLEATKTAALPIASVDDDLAALEELDLPAGKGPLPDLTPEPKQPQEFPIKILTPPAEIIEPAPTPKVVERVAPEPAKSVATGLEFYVDEDAFRASTSVSEVNLDQAMMEQSALRSYYGAMLARAEAQHARVKARFEVKEAQLYDTHRRSLAETGEKVTEKAVENAVKLDPAWLTAKNLVIEAESIAGVLKALNESLKDRRDMVIQLGADRRDETKGQARIMAREAAHQATRDAALEAGRRALAA
ncbi:hypothetical protein [Cupriavidus campinensis]|uniref:Uncharacterized protein n=1 Tax=Cupriavidus campinensis TaxID=151783 RepID=A0ABY3ESQ7_9BURK|nr:hypothetical protein [Cupriavidus campinensis]TSP13996.1 hypothetical protein FGG12_05865 [Cupriavidus campinensis]